MAQISDVTSTMGTYSSQVQQTSTAASSVNVTAASDTTTAKTGTDTDSVAISPAYSVEISQEGSRLSSTMKSGSSDGQTSGREGAAPTPPEESLRQELPLAKMPQKARVHPMRIARIPVRRIFPNTVMLS